MKPALVDTDILSEFLRGTSKVVDNVEKYLQLTMLLISALSLIMKS